MRRISIPPTPSTPLVSQSAPPHPVDIPLNMLTTFKRLDPERGYEVWEKSHKKIFRNYAFSPFFVIDILASIPFHRFNTDDDGNPERDGNQAARIARLPRAMRLFRMLRLFKLLRLPVAAKMFDRFATYFGLHAGCALRHPHGRSSS